VLQRSNNRNLTENKRNVKREKLVIK